MNTEKEITFTQLKAKFSKDLDAENKMNPFLEFSVGKNTIRTESAGEGSNKERAWKNQITLTYYQEVFINIKIYDQDTSENEVIGTVKLQTKSLRFPGGQLQTPLLAIKGEKIGTITGKYSIKNLAVVPLILLKNIKCQFIKQQKEITNSKPYLQFKSDEVITSCETIKESNPLNLVWSECLRLRITENSKINICLKDRKDAETYAFQHQCSAKEFRMTKGSKKYYVMNKEYQNFGIVQFDFQTVNAVSKEQSAKNAERQKKSENQLISITIQKIKIELKTGNKDIYTSFISESSRINTNIIAYLDQSASIDIAKTIYATYHSSKMTVLLWQKSQPKDKIIGVASFSLEGISSGNKTLKFIDAQQKEEGSAILTIITKQVPLKSLIIDEVGMLFAEGDLFSESSFYVVAKIGSCHGQTQASSKGSFSFKKSIELKYSVQQVLQLEVWNQHTSNDQIMYSQKIKLSDFKNQKGEMATDLTKTENDKIVKKGKLNFKYDLKKKVMEIQPTMPKTNLKGESKNLIQNKSLDNNDYKLKQQTNVSHQSLNKSSRSKQTLNLPSIISSHVNYGDQIFDKQSATTLQKSILVYSMPKGPRFINEPKYTGEPSYCLDSCFKVNPSKGAGIGFGRKKQFPDWMERNMKDNPPPGAYLDTNGNLRSKGPTFGISHKHYQKVLIGKEPKKSLSFTRKLSPIKQEKK